MTQLRFNEPADPNTDLRQEYGTPPALFNPLHQEFQFGVDTCAKDWNKKLDNYFSPDVNGLEQEWGLTAWCNPPYNETEQWIAKAFEERRHGTTTVMLLPSTTDVAWYHNFFWDEKRNRTHNGVELRFVRGRVKFLVPASIAAKMRQEGKKPGGGHTGSIIVIVRPIQTLHADFKPGEISACITCGRPMAFG